jgi:hypothetical protein
MRKKLFYAKKVTKLPDLTVPIVGAVLSSVVEPEPEPEPEP